MIIRQESHQPLEDGPDDMLFNEHGYAIFAYVRSQVNEREDANDIVFDVFKSALEHNNLLHIAPKERLAWLRRVAHNKIVDRYRRLKRRPVVALDSVADLLLDDERSSPEQMILQRERYEKLHDAIRKLPPLKQQLLQLRYGAGLNFTEIAQLLGKREDTVRKMLSRTLALLRKLYEHS